MRIRVIIEQELDLTIRGHGDSAVSRLERMQLSEIIRNGRFRTASVRLKDFNGNFEYEFAGAVESVLPMLGEEPGSEYCQACRRLRPHA